MSHIQGTWQEHVLNLFIQLTDWDAYLVVKQLAYTGNIVYETPSTGERRDPQAARTSQSADNSNHSNTIMKSLKVKAVQK